MSRLFQFALFFFSAIPLTSQIFDLAVTDDGGQLYFSTPFRQRGTDQYTHTKLFRIAENGLELVAQTERRMEGANTSNYYAPVEASVSGAGTLLAYTLRRDCIGGSGCVFVERNRGIVRGPAIAQPMEFQGRLQVSRNGRYVLQYGVISPVAVPMFLTDLSAATSVEIPGRTTIEPQGITNDGQVLMRSADGVRLWTPAASRTVLPGDAASSTIVNPTGRVVVCLLRSGEIRAIDVVSGGSALLPPGSGHSISNDGQWILYRNRDVFLVRSDGSGNRRLTSLNEEVVAATLTGDANAAFVATSGGRLLRIELPSGESRELVPRTPFLRERTGAPVAGSLNWLRGSGFQGTTSVLIGDVPAPLLSVGPEEILFQIPWEVRGGPIPVVLQPNDSPFESAPVALDLPFTRPMFLYYGQDVTPPPGVEYGVIAIHQDFSSLVDSSRPALAGEIIHFYMSGLGPVTPTVPTGSPAPVDRVVPTVEPLPCRFEEEGRSAQAEVLFAGLAPGLIGIYQVSIRMAPGFAPGWHAIHCGDPDSNAVALLPVRAAETGARPLSGARRRLLPSRDRQREEADFLRRPRERRRRGFQLPAIRAPS